LLVFCAIAAVQEKTAAHKIHFFIVSFCLLSVVVLVAASR